MRQLNTYHSGMAGYLMDFGFGGFIGYGKCQRDRSVASAYQTALKKKDDIAIALALSPFARKTAELVKSGAYEAAAGSCYIIFRCLAKTCKEHENWFCGFTGMVIPTRNWRYSPRL